MFIKFVAKAFLVMTIYGLTDYARLNGYDKINKIMHKDNIHFELRDSK